jgi:SAM-dependent methyltransferase
MNERPPPSAEGFNKWYSDMAGKTSGDEIKRRHLGLPPRVLSSSLLTWDGLAEVIETLRLQPGGRLVDLACGRGGYGLEMAARTGATLIGVDWSTEAIAQATALAQQLGAEAEFRVGDLADTGLPAASADAVVCVDSIQFKPVAASFDEIHRVLSPGGRVALTTWEALDRSDERVLPVIRAVDVRSGLEKAGFVDIEVRERPEWRTAERALWDEAASLDPGDDPALQSLHDEGLRVLPVFDLTRRVLATASVDRRCPTQQSVNGHRP